MKNTLENEIQEILSIMTNLQSRIMGLQTRMRGAALKKPPCKKKVTQSTVFYGEVSVNGQITISHKILSTLCPAIIDNFGCRVKPLRSGAFLLNAFTSTSTDEYIMTTLQDRIIIPRQQVLKLGFGAGDHIQISANGGTGNSIIIQRV